MTFIYVTESGNNWQLMKLTVLVAVVCSSSKDAD